MGLLFALKKVNCRRQRKLQKPITCVDAAARLTIRRAGRRSGMRLTACQNCVRGSFFISLNAAALVAATRLGSSFPRRADLAIALRNHLAQPEITAAGRLVVRITSRNSHRGKWETLLAVPSLEGEGNTQTRVGSSIFEFYDSPQMDFNNGENLRANRPRPNSEVVKLARVPPTCGNCSNGISAANRTKESGRPRHKSSSFELSVTLLAASSAPGHPVGTAAKTQPDPIFEPCLKRGGDLCSLPMSTTTHRRQQTH